MATSVYPKTTVVERNVASGRQNGPGTLRLPLNRDLLTAEHQVVVRVSQSGVVAPATAPTDLLAHVSRMVKSLSVETDDGPIIAADGLPLAMLASFTESQPAPRFGVDAAGNGTAELAIDLHHENDGALHDLLTALETGSLSKCDLVLTLADPVAAGLWSAAAAGAGQPVFDVRVQAEQYPDLTGVGDSEVVQGIDPETGEATEEPNPHYGVGTLVHRVMQQRKTLATAGQHDFMLQSVGNALRFIELVAIDPATGMPVDGAITDVRLVVAGEEVRNVQWRELQAKNEARRGFRHVGVAVIDFGDDEEGFLDLGDVAEARLFVTATGTPANVDLYVVEDYTAEA